MMTSTTTHTPGNPNLASPHLQLELYRFVELADQTHNFQNGLDLYYQLLNTLNKYIR